MLTSRILKTGNTKLFARLMNGTSKKQALERSLLQFYPAKVGQARQPYQSIREFHSSPREFHSSPREFHSSPRKFHSSPREFHSSPREFHSSPRELPSSSREFHSSSFQSMSASSKVTDYQTMAGHVGIATITAVGLGTAWFLKKYGLREHEVPVLGTYINLSENKYAGSIVPSDKFKKIGIKTKGHLSGLIVIDLENSTHYLQKGAQSSRALLYEFAISYFLSKLRPQEQPKSLILQEKQESSVARYYTLSEMMPNTMDLEDFVMHFNWKEALSKGKLVGLEEALASDLMFADTDIKLANLLVTKKTDKEGNDLFVVTAIDHECSGQSLFSGSIFLTNPVEMLNAVRDFQPYNDDWNPVPNAGSKPVLEFKNYIIEKKLLKEQNIINFYKKVSETNLDEINNILQVISAETGIFSRAEGEEVINTIKKVQADAHDFLEKNKMVHNEDQSPRLRMGK